MGFLQIPTSCAQPLLTRVTDHQRLKVFGGSPVYDTSLSEKIKGITQPRKKHVLQDVLSSLEVITTFQ